MASIFDAFTVPNTAGPQIADLNQAYGLALPALQQGSQDLTQYYSQALQPFTQNYQQVQPYLGASNQAASRIANVNTGLGSGLNANQNNIGQLGWAYGTGIGNAQANQNIENTQAAAAPWNLLLGLGGMKTNATGGTVGGNALTRTYLKIV